MVEIHGLETADQNADVIRRRFIDLTRARRDVSAKWVWADLQNGVTPNSNFVVTWRAAFTSAFQKWCSEFPSLVGNFAEQIYAQRKDMRWIGTQLDGALSEIADDYKQWVALALGECQPLGPHWRAPLFLAGWPKEAYKATGRVWLHMLHYCIDNAIPYTLSVPIDQFKDSGGKLDDKRLEKALMDGKHPIGLLPQAFTPTRGGDPLGRLDKSETRQLLDNLRIRYEQQISRAKAHALEAISLQFGKAWEATQAPRTKQRPRGAQSRPRTSARSPRVWFKSDPVTLRRRQIILKNTGMSNKSLCNVFDGHVPPISFPRDWQADFKVRTWAEAYKNSTLRNRINKMIGTDRRSGD